MDKQNLAVPKHRFDCINLALKESKQKLSMLIQEDEIQKLQILDLKKQLLISKVETKLALARAKNVKAVLGLLDLDKLNLDHEGNVPELNEQLTLIKKNQEYLFELDPIAYIVIPLNNESKVLASIDKYLIEKEIKK